LNGIEHKLAAHCESGVTSALLTAAGVPISEAKVLGIGSGLFFLHLPLDNFFGAPTTSFRSKPGSIFGKVTRRLKVGTRVERFGNPRAAHEALLRLVDAGKPVGLQTSVYFLEYLPRRFRFPFNAHNIIVHGRRDGKWLVSDPVLADAVECDDASLDRARFAAGLFAPRGKAYWVEQATAPQPQALAEAMRAGMRETGFAMSRIPIPVFGHRAIALLAKRASRWPERFKKDPQQALLQLANVVRMQEEIGTGGAGFRYVYAAFLQETAELFGDAEYTRLSERLTAIGDTWRKFAGHCARLFRGGQATSELFAPVVELLEGLAESERQLFDALYTHVRYGRAALPNPESAHPERSGA
jgi:hypothetical protein